MIHPIPQYGNLKVEIPLTSAEVKEKIDKKGLGML